jgi:hypothetical protein
MAKAAVALLLELCPGCLCAGGGAEEGVLQEEPLGGGDRSPRRHHFQRPGGPAQHPRAVLHLGRPPRQLL